MLVILTKIGVYIPRPPPLPPPLDIKLIIFIIA